MLLKISSFLLWTWLTKTMVPMLWKTVIPQGLTQSNITSKTILQNEQNQDICGPWSRNSFLEFTKYTKYTCLECTCEILEEVFMSICNYFSNYQKNVTPILVPAIDRNVATEKLHENHGIREYRDKGTSICGRILLALFLPIISLYIFND